MAIHLFLISRRKIVDKSTGPALLHPIHLRLPPVMAPLSSCHISGVFSLSDGSLDTEVTYYAQYLSALEFHDDNWFINVSIRKFTPSAEVLCPDDSMVFLVAKVALPSGGDGMLDPTHCTPFRPLEGFDRALPLDPTHIAFVTGVVSDVSDTVGYGPNRSFTSNTSEYVRDAPLRFGTSLS